MSVGVRLMTALMIAVVAGVWGDEPAKAPKAPEAPPKAIVDEVAKVSKGLGADTFRLRRAATKRLLEIANTTKTKDGKPIRPYEGYVWKQMKELSKSSDPEMSQRAREIHLKLNPGAYVDLSALGQLTYQLNQGDTLNLIAATFGTKVEWVKAANQGLRSDDDLKKFTCVKVPVAKDGEWADSIGGDVEIEVERRSEEFFDVVNPRR